MPVSPASRRFTSGPVTGAARRSVSKRNLKSGAPGAETATRRSRVRVVSRARDGLAVEARSAGGVWTRGLEALTGRAVRNTGWTVLSSQLLASAAVAADGYAFSPWLWIGGFGAAILGMLALPRLLIYAYIKLSGLGKVVDKIEQAVSLLQSLNVKFYDGLITDFFPQNWQNEPPICLLFSEGFKPIFDGISVSGILKSPIIVIAQSITLQYLWKKFISVYEDEYGDEYGDDTDGGETSQLRYIYFLAVADSFRILEAYVKLGQLTQEDKRAIIILVDAYYKTYENSLSDIEKEFSAVEGGRAHDLENSLKVRWIEIRNFRDELQRELSRARKP